MPPPETPPDPALTPQRPLPGRLKRSLHLSSITQSAEQRAEDELEIQRIEMVKRRNWDLESLQYQAKKLGYRYDEPDITGSEILKRIEAQRQIWAADELLARQKAMEKISKAVNKTNWSEEIKTSKIKPFAPTSDDIKQGQILFWAKLSSQEIIKCIDVDTLTKSIELDMPMHEKYANDAQRNKWTDYHSFLMLRGIWAKSPMGPPAMEAVDKVTKK